MKKIIYLFFMLFSVLTFSSTVNAENWEEFSFLKTNRSPYTAILYFDKDSTYFDGEKIVTKLKSVDSHVRGSVSIINAYIKHVPLVNKKKETIYIYSLYFTDRTDYYKGEVVQTEKFEHDGPQGSIFEIGKKDFIEIVRYAGFNPYSLYKQYQQLR